MSSAPGPADEGQEESTERQESRRRHRKSKKLESVNTWDVPEFMRGAKPRAEPSEREAFERRSFAVYKAEVAARSAESVAYEFERNVEYTKKFTDEISELVLMFPQIELPVIQEIYLLADGEKNAAIEHLLSIASDDALLPSHCFLLCFLPRFASSFNQP